MHEANVWSGDPHEAPHQACITGATYLDLLDTLARVHGAPDVGECDYQLREPEYSSLALTSFGAQWHIMVGYRRPCLKLEHAVHPSIGHPVYVCIYLYHTRTKSANSYKWVKLFERYGAAVSQTNKELRNSFFQGNKFTNGDS